MSKTPPDVYPGLIPLGGSGNYYMQIGKAAFNGVYTDTTDMPIRTQLTDIDFGEAVVYDTYSPATDATMTEYVLFVDVTVSSGACSVYRSSQGAVSGLPYMYKLIGRVEG